MLFSAGTPSQDMKEFLDWIASPAGQDVVDEADFVPLFLRPEMMNEPRPLRETAHFEASSSRPTARSIARIGLLIDELKERVGEHNHIVLEGYTDAREQNQMETQPPACGNRKRHLVRGTSQTDSSKSFLGARF